MRNGAGFDLNLSIVPKYMKTPLKWFIERSDRYSNALVERDWGKVNTELETRHKLLTEHLQRLEVLAKHTTGSNVSGAGVALSKDMPAVGTLG